MIIGNTKGFIRGKALSVEGHKHAKDDITGLTGSIQTKLISHIPVSATFNSNQSKREYTIGAIDASSICAFLVNFPITINASLAYTAYPNVSISITDAKIGDPFKSLNICTTQLRSSGSHTKAIQILRPITMISGTSEAYRNIVMVLGSDGSGDTQDVLFNSNNSLVTESMVLDIGCNVNATSSTVSIAGTFDLYGLYI